jgi:hypothetical protein
LRNHLSLGFRVKSGFAIAVVLSGPKSAPVALARRVVSLSDASVESTRQPYHDGFGTAQEDVKEIARLTAIIKRCATESVQELLADPMFAGRSCPKAGVVVGSVIDPATVGNPHIRAHASEGRLFRTVLADALGSRGIACTVVVEKTLGAEARKAIGKLPGQIAKQVARIGRELNGPWRAEEKSAATAAWMVL